MLFCINWDDYVVFVCLFVLGIISLSNAFVGEYLCFRITIATLHMAVYQYMKLTDFLRENKKEVHHKITLYFISKICGCK